MKQRPLVGTAVFVMRDGKFAMLRRASSHGTGTWGFIGGHLEYGESFEGCAAREVKEEIGVEIDNISVIGVTNDFFPKDEKHYVTVYMKADCVGTEKAQLMEPEKHDELRWVTWSEVPEPRFIAVDNFMKQNDASCLTAQQKEIRI